MVMTQSHLNAQVSQSFTEPKLLKIGDIAEMTGLTLRTLRYYEEMCLIEPEQRSKGNFRLYHPRVLTKLGFINSLKKLGLPLNEIKDLLGAPDAHLTDREVVVRTRQALTVKKQKIEENLAELSQMKTEVETALLILEDCILCKSEKDHPCDPGCDHKASHLE